MKKLPALLFLLIHSILIQAQNDSLIVVTELKASVNSDRVGVTFTLGKGSFCYGAILERTTDTLNPEAYAQLGEIEGVCGDHFKPVSYTLWDNEPITNRRVWYRVITGYVPTQFLEVEVPYFEHDNHGISPNPMGDIAELRLPAGVNGTLRIAIYNTTGALMQNKVIGSGNVARIYRGSLQEGVYLYRIYLDNKLYGTGKLVLR